MQSHDLQAEKILADGKNNPNISADLLRDCFKAMSKSSRTYGLFTAYFDEEFYRYAMSCIETRGYMDHMLGVVGVTKTLEDVEISQRNHLPYRDMQRFLAQDFAIINKDDQIPDKFKYYLTARVDFKLVAKTETPDFKIISVSDAKASVSQAGWLPKNELGYVIQSCSSKLDFVVKIVTDGNFVLRLRGIWFPDPKDKSKLIPYWIDYTKFSVNGKVIFDKLTPTWCDKPFNYSLDAKADDEIKIQVEWLPHRSDV